MGKPQADSFRLPAAVKCADSKNAEISMPVSALTLGDGNGRAKVQWIENIEGKALYFLKVGDTNYPLLSCPENHTF